MTYTHLLFDLDGTLFDFDAGETCAFHKVCDTFHIPYSDEVLSLYQRINLSYWKAYERGEITPAALAIARFRRFSYCCWQRRLDSGANCVSFNRDQPW